MNQWRDTLNLAVMHDDDGLIIGEIIGNQLTEINRLKAYHRGIPLGDYISREFARKAIEKAEGERNSALEIVDNFTKNLSI